MSYFIVGNAWLFVALVLVLGREDVGGYWRFFGLGEIEEFVYVLAILLSFGLGIGLLLLHLFQKNLLGKKKAPCTKIEIN
jgi:hypothetical protein